jgi:hypothetical protein
VKRVKLKPPPLPDESLLVDLGRERLLSLGWRPCRRPIGYWRHARLRYPWPKADALRLEDEWLAGYYDVGKLMEGPDQ